jgi:hypothetical protein
MTETDLTATLRYLIPGFEKPIYFASGGGADAALNIGAEFEDRNVTIYNARQLASPPTLDQQGFSLLPHISGVKDFYGLENVRAQYESRISELVRSVTGGEEVLVFDHTLRSDSRDIRGEHTTREPASVIHNDYTDASAVMRVRDLLPPEEAMVRIQHRFAIVNVWRSIKGPVLKSPLACCDASTLAPADLVASERRARERTGELELVSWNPQHTWYYYPDMNREEVLLIKTFDSALDGRARRSIHTAFDNPLAPVDAPPRESIESRLLVFF